MLTAGDHLMTLSVGGIRREFLVYVPMASIMGPRPCILLLPGTGATAKWALQETQFGTFADRHNFVAVVPQALAPDPQQPPKFLANPPCWNAGSRLFPDHRPDDLAFFDTLLNELPRHVNIDPHHVYVTGFSNGASMTFELAAHFSDRIAAIVPIAGYARTQATPKSPVPTLFIIGTSDPLVPAFGGDVTSPWTGATVHRPPALEGLVHWAAKLGCQQQRELVSEENGIRVERFAGLCDCTLIIVDDLGHHWPGGRGQLKRKLAGEPTDRLDANEAIWAFCSRHRLTS